MPDVKAFLQDIAKAGLDASATPPFLTKVMQIVPAIIYIYNQQTQSNEFTNRSLATSLGYSASEIQNLGADMMPSLCHPSDLPKIAAHFETLNTLENGEVVQIEYRMKHKDGHWVWLQSYDTIFERDSAGKVLRHIGAAVDITSQKHAEAQVQRDRHAAELANAELRSFAYAVSHDMKSPSNTLTLLLSELREDHEPALNDDARQLIDLGLETVDRMKELIEEVLSYTRMIGQQVSEDSVDAGPLFDKVKWDMRQTIASSGAQIQVGPLPNLVGNEPLLRTLFVNLVSNAIKFQLPGNTPNITITDVSEPGSKMASIAVADNGIGLPAKSEHRIFGMFNRLHTDDAYPGSGLGLSLCQRIAVNHGGEITVSSDEGKGATFTVLLKRS